MIEIFVAIYFMLSFLSLLAGIFEDRPGRITLGKLLFPTYYIGCYGLRLLTYPLGGKK